MAFTVGKLKEMLNDLDDDMPIVVENACTQLYLRSNDVTVEELDGKKAVVIYVDNY